MNETLKKVPGLSRLRPRPRRDVLAGVAALKAVCRRCHGGDRQPQGRRCGPHRREVPPQGGRRQRPDPAKYVPVGVVQEMQQQLAALQPAKRQRSSCLVEQAISEGRFIEAQRQWASDLARKTWPPQELRRATLAIAALGGMQSGGKGSGRGQPATVRRGSRRVQGPGLTAEQFAAGKLSVKPWLHSPPLVTLRTRRLINAFRSRPTPPCTRGALVVFDAGYAAPGPHRHGPDRRRPCRILRHRAVAVPAQVPVKVAPARNPTAADLVTQADVGPTATSSDDQTVAGDLRRRQFPHCRQDHRCRFGCVLAVGAGL